MDQEHNYDEDIAMFSERRRLQYPRPIPIIYGITVMATLAGIVLLPCLHVDVSIVSPGALRAATEGTTLYAVAPGLVKAIYAAENAPVRKGQLLFDIQSPALDEQGRFLYGKITEDNELISDIHNLIRGESDPTSSSHRYNALWRPSTNFYQQSLSDFSMKVVQLRIRLAKVKEDHDRNKFLYYQGVISRVEYEGFKFELDKANSDFEVFKASQLASWQRELQILERDLTDHLAQLSQAKLQAEDLRVKAPVDGTLQELAGIYPGSWVYAHQPLAAISPNREVLAEIYVDPADVGLLRVGMQVRLHVDAFNYNQWGFLTGNITGIANDVRLIKERPVFQVRCRIDQKHLTLKNGYQGVLKKGMTLQARFLVAKRSLLQLLYDKVDDWVNPQVMNPGARK